MVDNNKLIIKIYFNINKNVNDDNINALIKNELKKLIMI